MRRIILNILQSNLFSPFESIANMIVKQLQTKYSIIPLEALSEFVLYVMTGNSIEEIIQSYHIESE